MYPTKACLQPKKLAVALRDLSQSLVSLPPMARVTGLGCSHGLWLPQTSECSTSGRMNMARRRHSLAVHCSASGSGAGSQGKRAGDKQKKTRARDPGLYEVCVTTPPEKSLGIYALPVNTQTGEEIEIDGAGYMVHRTVVQFKLQKGRYVRDHNRLDVQPTGRYFLNLMLDGLIRGKYIGPTGLQD